ncbi:MAG: hypothetical protein LC777_18580, partial [Actinobacteria bacterium]|nr:hypothetical protein [Actinomycetota bacterium]
MTGVIHDPGLSANFRYTTSTDTTAVAVRYTLLVSPDSSRRRRYCCSSQRAVPNGRLSASRCMKSCVRRHN